MPSSTPTYTTANQVFRLEGLTADKPMLDFTDDGETPSLIAAKGLRYSVSGASRR